jgi:peptide deformylase
LSILKVARMGHPLLRRMAEDIPERALKSEELQSLVADLLETMDEYVGVGLAAPQVHCGLRLFIIQPDPGDEETLRVAVNPVITPLTEETTEGWEGCLSIPDIHGMVLRYTRVRLDAWDAEGEKYSAVLEDFAARVAQHEADHLNGVLFVDRMTNMSSLAFGDEYRRYHAPRPEPKEGEEGEEGEDGEMEVEEEG